MTMVSNALAFEVAQETGPEQFARMAQDMFAQAKIDDTLATVLRLSRETFPCDAVSIMLASDGGRIAQAAASSGAAARADELQLEFREGPSLQSLTGRQHLTVNDLRFDSRWRFWAPQAADLGHRSAMSLSLDDDETVGALTLYSHLPSFFHADDVALGEIFARHASTSVAIARERDQLLKAVDSRGVVGQAQGILMERYDVDADQAFQVLRRYSSHLNQKLRSIAEGVVRSRALPDLQPGELYAVPAPGRRPLRLVASGTQSTDPQRS